MKHPQETVHTKEYLPIILPFILVLLGITFLLTIRMYPNLHFGLVVLVYAILDIGFIFALILSFTSKLRSMKIISILTNSVLFVVSSIWTFLLFAAYGIGGA
ncbi:hypothetical protein [Bacillus massiliigorillae]|uniref:hypothetical protein n=1 Tax=Bacillus massiliigorillae TaxID=1243664 RepID=UPI000399F820|nr:hypothetical protein [Bacillus massiliigorillae]